MTTTSAHSSHPARALGALVTAAVVLMVALAAFAAPASASRKQITILDATQEALGFDGAAIRQQTFDDLDQLGVDYVRILVWWKDYAPQPGSKQKPSGFNPANSNDYGSNGANFAGLDVAVQMATDRGLGVYLVPSAGPNNGEIPRWAARRPALGAFDPKPSEFEAFLHALGERYSGSFDPDGTLGLNPVLPRVGMMGINNEPNAENFLFPQVRKGKTVGPTLYRHLYLAARRGLADAGWQGKVLIGETAPRGVLNNTAPIPFLRGVLCLNSHYKRKKGCEPLKATAWAHHPYSLLSPPWDKRVDRSSLTLGVIGRLRSALNRAARAGAIRKGLPIFISEYAFQSKPDKFGLPLVRQSEYLSQAERIAFYDNRIGAFAQYLMRDDPFRSGFQSGLRFAKSGAVPCGGKKQGCKPAFAGFRTPLAVRQRGKRALIWGRIRPATGPVTADIRVQDKGKGARLLRTVSTDASGYFSFKSKFKPGRRWGVNWSGFKSPMVRGFRY